MAWEYVVSAVFVLLGICIVLYQHRKRKKAEKLAAGLQCWNEKGEICFDSTVNTTKVLGSFNTGTHNGSKTIQLGAGEKLWATVNYVTPSNRIGIEDFLKIPRIVISENVISWTFDDFAIDSYIRNWMWSYKYVNISANVIYGVCV